MVINKKTILILLILGVCGILIYKGFDNNKVSEYKFTPKEDVIKAFENNYLVFERVSERIADKDGYFYADYMDNKLVIDTNIQSIKDLDLNSRQEFESDISFIIAELKFIGVYKDEGFNYISYKKEENAGGQDIIYSSKGDFPKCGVKELIKQNWYYYVWQGV